MTKTILLADDSATIRRIVELTFSGTEVRVESVPSGRAALERLESVRPDLVVADAVMPGPTGYEICRKIKRSSRPVPVLLLAGTFEPYDHELAREVGADGHLVKPFESGVLRSRCERLLNAGGQAVEPQGAGESLPGELEQTLEELSEERAEAADTDLSEAARGASVGEPHEPESPSVRPAVELSGEFVDSVARAVVERLSEDVVREIAWEVVPEIAARIVRERIRELEREEP